jgi:hypothetical protein
VAGGLGWAYDFSGMIEGKQIKAPDQLLIVESSVKSGNHNCHSRAEPALSAAEWAEIQAFSRVFRTPACAGVTRKRRGIFV